MYVGMAHGNPKMKVRSNVRFLTPRGRQCTNKSEICQSRETESIPYFMFSFACQIIFESAWVAPKFKICSNYYIALHDAAIM